MWVNRKAYSSAFWPAESLTWLSGLRSQTVIYKDLNAWIALGLHPAPGPYANEVTPRLLSDWRSCRSPRLGATKGALGLQGAFIPLAGSARRGALPDYKGPFLALGSEFGPHK